MAVRRSIFSRIVALAILLSLALVSGLWVLTDQTIRVTLEGSARKAVDVDLAGLADIHASSGREELERRIRSEEHTSELQSLMRISYAVFCLKKKKAK